MIESVAQRRCMVAHSGCHAHEREHFQNTLALSDGWTSCSASNNKRMRW